MSGRTYISLKIPQAAVLGVSDACSKSIQGVRGEQHVCAQMYVRVSIYMYYIYLCVCVYIYIYIYICIYNCMHSDFASLCVCMYVMFH